MSLKLYKNQLLIIKIYINLFVIDALKNKIIL